MKQKKNNLSNNIKFFRKRPKSNGTSVRDQLNKTFHQSILVFFSIIVVLMILTISLTLINKSIFKTYGSGQGKVGSLELKFNSLHAKLRYLVYDSSTDQQTDTITTIEKLSEELLKGANDLEAYMTNDESKEAYDKIMTLLAEYIPTKDEIVQYERDQGKYNSTKLYADVATGLANDLDNTINELFTFMSMQGTSYSQTTLFIGIITTIIALLAIFYSISVVFRKVNKTIQDICGPLQDLTDASREIAQGNLQVKIIEGGDNEIGILARALSNTVESLNLYIHDISEKLQYIVDNDLTIALDQEYVGDFQPIKESIAKILDFLNGVFRQIEQASSEVYSGAEQVSDGAMDLAESCSTQNEAIQEILTSMQNITNNAKSNEALCETANQLTLSVRSSAESSREKMNRLVDMMSVINDTSEQISLILQNINDIADQTNLLSVNAQIEAARAGEYGKGFTVVANEVAKLAEKCSLASKQTEKMINDTLNAVHKGDSEAKSTALVLKETEDQIDIAVDAVNRIFEETNKQQKAIEHILDEINNISDIVRGNSATAQESAAASEQLAAQCDILRTMLQTMKLR